MSVKDSIKLEHLSLEVKLFLPVLIPQGLKCIYIHLYIYFTYIKYINIYQYLDIDMSYLIIYGFLLLQNHFNNIF